MYGHKSQPRKSPSFVRKKDGIILSSDEEDGFHANCKPQDMEKEHVSVKKENQQEISRIVETEDMTSRKRHELNRHPSVVVESSSLGSVSLPKVTFNLDLPKDTIDRGVFSPLQLECITRACQRHEQKTPDGSRAGFLIGYGAGFGKGRIAAGIILVNYLQDRKKAIWLSVSSDLRYDAERDLRDVGLADKHDKITIFNLKKMTRDTSGFNDSTINIVFSTYTTLTEEFRFIGATSTQMKLLLNLCGGIEFDGVIIFDECHQTSRLDKDVLEAALDLQKRLPNARVVYMSATGVSEPVEPRNMAFMSRLGLWGKDTSFKEFKNFLHTFKKGGVGSSEIVAIDMKQRGMYIASQLSFENVKFKLVQVNSSDSVTFVEVYDNAVKLWLDLKESFAEAEKISSADPETGPMMWDYFWLAHFNFFKYLCISAKVMDAVKIAKRSLKNGKCVVIGIQTTGEAHTLDQKTNEDGELPNFYSTGKSILLSLVEKYFQFLECYDSSTSNAAGRKRKSVLQTLRESKRKMIDPENEFLLFDYNSDMRIEDSEDWNSEDSDSEDSDSEEYVIEEFVIKESVIEDSVSGESVIEESVIEESENSEGEERLKKISSIKVRLLTQIEKFSAILPKNNVLDQLIDKLGGPEHVAEISDRMGRVVQKDNGQMQLKSRCDEYIPFEFINIREKALFMSGKKNIAIVSEIASNGISLHADHRSTNQRTRVYISLEWPSSIDIAIQQFCITCRCNQVSAPEYFLLYSDLAGEKKFALMVAKRLKSLGAVDLDNHPSFEIDNKNEFSIDKHEYGRQTIHSIREALKHHTSGHKSINKSYHVDTRGDNTRWMRLQLSQMHSPFSNYYGGSFSGFHNRPFATARPTSPRLPPPSDYPSQMHSPFSNYYGGSFSGFHNRPFATARPTSPRLPPPSDYQGEFFTDVKKALAGVDLISTADVFETSVSEFLKRILGVPVELQKRLYKYFTDTMAAVISQGIKTQEFDGLDIVDWGIGQNVRRRLHFTFTTKYPTGPKIELHRFEFDHAMTSWNIVREKWESLTEENEGFFIPKETLYRNDKYVYDISLVVQNKEASYDGVSYAIIKPNRKEQMSEKDWIALKLKSIKIIPNLRPFTCLKVHSKKLTLSQMQISQLRDIEKMWNDRNKTETLDVVCGPVHFVWKEIAVSGDGMQVVRVNFQDILVVGLVVPKGRFMDLADVLL